MGTDVSERVAGLRALADHLETHPQLISSSGACMSRFASDREDFASLAAQLGGHRSKGANDEYMVVTRDFGGGVTLEVFAPRNEVCEARVTGTETVLVPDPAAPLIEVTRDVVEWECAPVLDAS